MRELTASDRSALIKLAKSMPKGDETRKAILAGLQIAKEAADKPSGKYDGNFYNIRRAGKKPMIIKDVDGKTISFSGWKNKTAEQILELHDDLPELDEESEAHLIIVPTKDNPNKTVYSLDENGKWEEDPDWT